MSSTSNTSSRNSHDWMLRVGIDRRDVEWLNAMSGSPEIHSHEYRERAIGIFTRAMAGMLASQLPLQTFICLYMEQ